MAYFAKINPSTNVVEKVVLIQDSEASTETEGKNRCVELFGATADEYIQTTKSTDFRGPFAKVDGTWDDVNEVFIPPSTFEGWIWSNSNLTWEPPSTPPVPLLEDLAVGVTTNLLPRWIDDKQSWVIEETDDITIE
jgi:hypothetical protein